MSTAAEVNRLKAARRDPSTGDRVARGGPGKQRGDVVVECLTPRMLGIGGRWRKWRSYRDRETAERAIAGFRRKYSSWGWRIADS